jgi:hypothetical protein
VCVGVCGCVGMGVWYVPRCVCACVCMCVHVCACVCMCVHVCACVCMCVHVCACVCMCVSVWDVPRCVCLIRSSMHMFDSPLPMSFPLPIALQVLCVRCQRSWYSRGGRGVPGCSGAERVLQGAVSSRKARHVPCTQLRPPGASSHSCAQMDACSPSHTAPPLTRRCKTLLPHHSRLTCTSSYDPPSLSLFRLRVLSLPFALPTTHPMYGIIVLCTAPALFNRRHARMSRCCRAPVRDPAPPVAPPWLCPSGGKRPWG